ncbi:MAG: PEP-CTERM sorting domain-containing protein [Sedimentisphaerales bacterium]
MIKRNTLVCLTAVIILAAGSQASIIDVFDGGGIGTTYTNFSSLAAAHANFMGTVQDSITFSEYQVGTVIDNQYSASKGVTFSNPGQQLACVMYEGYSATSGYIPEPLDGYDGSYKPDMDKALAEYPNNDASPFTITFANPVSTVGSFAGMGKEGIIDTLTITAMDASNKVLAVLTVKTAPWTDDRNREGLWGIRSSFAEIAKITIRNNSCDNYANALIFDTLQWSSQPMSVPEPATIGILSLGALSLIGRKKQR